ncbi:Uncharacterised protein [Klebsiella pneumoniae]|nr:Uncharacterised protein [Klebsiella pneumoniae]
MGWVVFSSAYLFDNGNRTILTERIPGFRHLDTFLFCQPNQKRNIRVIHLANKK